jgi:hypothetical protein
MVRIGLENITEISREITIFKIFMMFFKMMHNVFCYKNFEKHKITKIF